MFQSREPQESLWTYGARICIPHHQHPPLLCGSRSWSMAAETEPDTPATARPPLTRSQQLRHLFQPSTRSLPTIPVLHSRRAIPWSRGGSIGAEEQR